MPNVGSQKLSQIKPEKLLTDRYNNTRLDNRFGYQMQDYSLEVSTFPVVD